jgi:hypothetical protein
MSKAHTAFLLHSLELVNHFAPVWDQLLPGSFDIVLFGVAQDAAAAATRKWNCRLWNADDVINARHKFRFLVSNHPAVGAYNPPLVQQIAEHNVRFMYAAGKTGWNLASWNQIYDAILCFGPYHAEAFSEICDAAIIQMGYPRFDRYFNEQPDLAALKSQYGCDPGKDTIVWLPTWKALSSVGHFDEEIGALTEKYNVVVKVHPLMPESEPHRVHALARQPLTHLITDHSDNLPLYQLADFMLFDYGGPPMAALYTDKNFLLLDVPGASQDIFTGPQSPDVALRRHFKHLAAGSGNLEALLADETLWDEHRVMRAELRRKYFAPHFGFAAYVAAQALMHMDRIAAQQKAGGW